MSRSPRRVCVLGNSHVIPFFRVWTEQASNIEATFIAAPGTMLEELQIASGRIESGGRLREALNTWAGVTAAALADFDAFAVIGLQFGVNRCARPLANDEKDVWPGSLSVDAQEQLGSTTAMRIVRKLREETASPIILVAQPCLSERVLELEMKPSDPMRELLSTGREKEVRVAYERACETMDVDLEIVQQPPETIVHEILTLRQYDCAPADRDPDDYFQISHANVEYARLVMRELRERLTG